MSDQDKENRKTENEQDQNTYRFMDQTIKKRPVNHKAIVLRIAGMLGAGVVIGLTASLVFTLTQPALRQNANTEAVSEKVTIPPDKEPSGEDTAADPVNTEDSKDDLTEQNGTVESIEEPETAEAGESGQEIQETESTAEENAPVEETSGKPAEVSAALQDETAGVPEEEQTDMVKEVSETEEPEGSGSASVSEAAEPAAKNPESEEVYSESTEGTPEETEPEAEEKQPEEETDPGKEKKEEQPDVSEEGSAEEDILDREAGITLQEYRELNRSLVQVAEETEHAIVQVIGITSEIDYFNQNYENQRRISGLTVAMTDEDLFILTEYRVVDQVERIQVVFCDGRMVDATFQKADQNTGLAIVKVPLDTIPEETREKVTVASLGNSFKVQRGDPVLAVGSPLGFTDSIAVGIITSTGSKAPAADTEYPLLNTDIEGGADGSGVLIDLDGKIVGIISGSFGNSTGCITGLAISQLKEIIEGLSNNESFNYVGILGQDVTRNITERTGIPRGILVTEAQEDSPAMLAGIKEYDVIVKVGDQSVYTLLDYHKVLKNLEPDKPISFTAMRKGTEGYAEVTFEVTVEGR